MIKKLITIVLVTALAVISVLYFEMPFNAIIPVFHKQTILYYSQTYNIDPLFVSAIIKAESKFLSKAKSRRGAVGLMQLMPSTAKELAEELGYKNITEKDLEDPKKNINLGMYYLSKLDRMFNGDKILILSAYNAGISNAISWRNDSPEGKITVNDIPYRETKRYVQRVLRTYQWLKETQKITRLIREKII